MARIQFPRVGFLLCHRVQTRSENHSLTLTSVYRGSFPVIELMSKMYGALQQFPIQLQGAWYTEKFVLYNCESGALSLR